MKQITIPELVKLCAAAKNPVSRQAVHKAINAGLFPFKERDGKKYVDPDNKAVQEYIHGTNRQREAVAASKKSVGKPAKTKTPAKLSPGKPMKPAPPPQDENLDPHEMNRRAKFADMRKRELQVLVMEKKYLPVEFIDAVYIKYLENFNAIMERNASTFIQDIGKRILEAGEVLPEHIEKFTGLVLEAMNNNKKTVRKLIKDYEPHL